MPYEGKLMGVKATEGSDTLEYQKFKKNIKSKIDSNANPSSPELTSSNPKNVDEQPPTKQRRTLGESSQTQFPSLTSVGKIPSKPLQAIIDWDPDNLDNYYTINHGIGYADIPKVCKPFIDTLCFGRLRNIKQLGACYYVYPEAVHTRHAHCIGTAELAAQLVKKLRHQKINGKKPFTGSEVLCVIVAALAHDLGHGPFSHLSERLFEGQISHEEMSVLLFEKILEDHEEIKKAYQVYFTDYHFKLIKHFINPNVSNNSKPWDHLDLSEKDKLAFLNKAFLFAIVNNPFSGFDVDKLDYLSRDSRCGFPGIDEGTIERLFSSVKIVSSVENPKFKWIGFCDEEYHTIKKIFETRIRFHQVVYCHKNVLAANILLVQAIKLAAPHLTFLYNGKTVTWKEVFIGNNYLDLFIQLTDEFVRNGILYSNSGEEDMKKARQILIDLEYRRFPKPILVYENLDKHYPCLRTEEIKAALKSCRPLSFNEEIFIIRKDFHGGLGLNINPMDKILFYSKSDKDNSYYKMRSPLENESVVFIFAPHTCTTADVTIIEAALIKHTNNYGIKPPRRIIKNKENITPYLN